MSSPSTHYTNSRIDGVNLHVDAANGVVRADPMKLAWVGSMFLLGTIGSAATYSGGAVLLFFASTITTLCLGHSLGMHRRFIHRSYDCPKWMEYFFVHLGVLVGLAGPLGMLRCMTYLGLRTSSTCTSYIASASAAS